MFFVGTVASINIAASATITGGNGGAGGLSTGLSGHDGAGGAGIAGSVLTIVVSGTIAGGVSGDAVPVRADAIDFIGGVNSLTLEAGYNIIGNVVASNIAGEPNVHTLVLGGDTSPTAPFDVSSGQFQGFGSFEKTGLSTWILTGTTSADTPWTINGGTLDLAALGAAGAGQITFGAGTETLMIENAALFHDSSTSNSFGNLIQVTGVGDIIDLAGLTFAKNAKVSYNPNTDILSVTSGGVTDNLTVVAPHGATFALSSDGAQGTDVTLVGVASPGHGHH
jgi:hypothetical protein